MIFISISTFARFMFFIAICSVLIIILCAISCGSLYLLMRFELRHFPELVRVHPGLSILVGGGIVSCESRGAAGSSKSWFHQQVRTTDLAGTFLRGPDHSADRDDEPQTGMDLTLKSTEDRNIPGGWFREMGPTPGSCKRPRQLHGAWRSWTGR